LFGVQVVLSSNSLLDIDSQSGIKSELPSRESFCGYGPEQGYDFLRHAIAQNDYRDKGIDIADDDIFVSDGSKCDAGNILDILGDQNSIPSQILSICLIPSHCPRNWSFPAMFPSAPGQRSGFVGHLSVGF